MVIGLSQDHSCQNVLRGLRVAQQMELLTIALTSGSSTVMSAHATVDHNIVRTYAVARGQHSCSAHGPALGALAAWGWYLCHWSRAPGIKIACLR